MVDDMDGEGMLTNKLGGAKSVEEASAHSEVCSKFLQAIARVDPECARDLNLAIHSRGTNGGFTMKNVMDRFVATQEGKVVYDVASAGMIEWTNLLPEDQPPIFPSVEFVTVSVTVRWKLVLPR